VKVRTLINEDISKVIDLLVGSELIPSPEEAKIIIDNSIISPLSQFFVAVEEESAEIRAVVCWDLDEFAPDGSVLEIGYLAVEERFQRQKIGTGLLEQSFKYVQQMLAKKVSVVFVRAEPETTRFYSESFKMKKEGETKDFWDKKDKIIFMVRRFH